MLRRAIVLPLAIMGASCASDGGAGPSGANSLDGSAGGGAAGVGGHGDAASDARNGGNGGAGGGALGGTGGGGVDAAADALPDGPSVEGGDDAPADTGQLYVYVSGYAPTIGIYAVDGTGALQSAGSAPAMGSPSFLAVNPAHTHLYAVDENNTGRVAAFAIDASSGALTALNAVSSGGSGPAFVSTDHTGRWVLVANYTSGTVAVLPAAADGSLSDATDTQSPGQLAHQIVTDPSNAFVFVPCKGSDLIKQFVFDAGQGKLMPNGTADAVHTKQGAGPRHLAFHPSGTFAYVINELDSTIIAYDFDAAHGTLAEKQTISTLPANFQGTNTAAEIAVSPSGAFVYGSNRGDDSIGVFSVAADGKLTLVGHVKTGGKTPRDFTLDPAGNVLLAANQDSNNVVPFHIDAQTGLPSPMGATLTATSPSFVGYVLLHP